MRIVYDIRASQTETRFHGGLVYSEEMLDLVARAARARRNVELLLAFDEAKPLSDRFHELRKEHGLRSIAASSAPAVIDACRTLRPDALFSPLPYDWGAVSDDLNALSGMRKVFVVHGLRMLECPRDVGELWMLPALPARRRLSVLLKWLLPVAHRARKRALYGALFKLSNTLIVTDSRHSKYSILTLYPHLYEKDIQVCYPPVRRPFGHSPSQARDVLARFGLEHEGFFLSVGMGFWYKNLRRLLQAIRLIEKRLRPDLTFVITGLDPALRTLAKRHSGRSGHRLILLPFLDTQDLDILLSSAYALLFPSLNEGYGYPPLEAGRWGTPVLASAVTSIPEVCGDAALFFDPRNPVELANGILQIVEEPALRQDLAQAAVRRTATVEAKAKKMHEDVLRNLLENSTP